MTGCIVGVLCYGGGMKYIMSCFNAVRSHCNMDSFSEMQYSYRWWGHDMKTLYWPFVQGIHQWLVDSQHIRPVLPSFASFFVISLDEFSTFSQMTNEMRCSTLTKCPNIVIDTQWLAHEGGKVWVIVCEFRVWSSPNIRRCHLSNIMLLWQLFYNGNSLDKLACFHQFTQFQSYVDFSW